MKRYLIWDFDGTLAVRQGGWSGALLQTLRQYGTESFSSITAERLQPYLLSGFPWHVPEREHDLLSTDAWWDILTPVFAQAYAVSGVSPNEAQQLAGHVRGVYADLSYWHLMEDARGTLDELSSLGWTHLLLSNHVPELPELLDGLKIRDCFAHVFNSADSRHEKPHPEAFRAVLHYIQTEGAYDAVWMIGDNPVADIKGAEAVGIPGVLVGSWAGEVARRVARLGDVIATVQSANRRSQTQALF